MPQAVTRYHKIKPPFIAKDAYFILVKYKSLTRCKVSPVKKNNSDLVFYKIMIHIFNKLKGLQEAQCFLCTDLTELTPPLYNLQTRERSTAARPL